MKVETVAHVLGLANAKILLPDDGSEHCHWGCVFVFTATDELNIGLERDAKNEMRLCIVKLKTSEGEDQILPK